MYTRRGDKSLIPPFQGQIRESQQPVYGFVRKTSVAQTEKQTQDAFARERREWENQRAALTEEKDAVSNRLSEVLALLLPPVPAATPVFTAQETASR